MNPLTLEWIQKAEADLHTARREYRVRNVPNYDAVCFHSQQAAEKYLKAVLQEKGMTIPRIHSLVELIALLSKNDDDFLNVQTNAMSLESYAIQFRYPGLTANKMDAKAALSSADRVCTLARIKLNS